MKLFSAFTIASALFSSASAHYIFTNINGNSAAVRQPANNSPVTSVTSSAVRCNSAASASAVVNVAAGGSITFGLDNTFYHLGPGALYLARAPSDVKTFNGDGQVWFKIAEWGATFNPFSFKCYNLNGLTATIPRSISSGQYLVRAEQIGLHVAGAPQFYVSCGQINVTGGGSANPSKVSIPGYVSASDPGLTVNIYNPVPTAYKVPSLQFVHSHDALHPHSAAIWALAVTPSADVLTASLDGTLALYTSSVTQSTSGFPKDEDIPSDAQELDAGARIRTWPAHPLAWVSLSVTANPTRSEGSDESDVSRRALVNSIAGTTMLVDYTSGEVLGTKNIGEKQSGPGTSSGYAEPAWSVSLASDGKTYASTGGSGSVTIHSAIPSSSSTKSDSMEEGFGSRLADIPTGRVKFGMFVDHCPTDDNKVAMSNETGQVFILDVEKATVSTSWASHAMPVRSLGWSGDGNLIMSASDDRRLVLHDARVSTTSSSSAVAHLTGHALPVLSVALSPGDGRLALSGSRDGTVRVWDVGMRKSVGVVREGKPVWGVAWRPIGNVSSNMEDGLTSSATGGFGGIGGTGASGFVTGGEEGLVRWYRGAGQV